jgi:hypothetical protein
METFTRHTGFSMFSNKRLWIKKILEEGGASTIKMNKILRQNNALKDFILSIKHRSLALYTENIISTREGDNCIRSLYVILTKNLAYCTSFDVNT